MLATRSGALVPVTAGPACLAPGGFGAPDLAPFLVRCSGLGDGAVVDLRAWHVSATAVDLRLSDRAVTPVARFGRGVSRAGGFVADWPITRAPGAERDRRLKDRSALATGLAADCAVTREQVGDLDRRPGDRLARAAGFAITRAQVAELDHLLPDRAADFAAGECAEGLARSALGAGELAACVAAAVGAGPGTTPAGDDVICGVLAGLDLLGLRDAHQRLGAAVTPLLWATTRSSRHLLAAAVEGRYTERLLGLAAALAAGRSAAPALDALARWGASSGLDQATGFAAALRAGSLVGGGAR